LQPIDDRTRRLGEEENFLQAPKNVFMGVEKGEVVRARSFEKERRRKGKRGIYDAQRGVGTEEASWGRKKLLVSGGGIKSSSRRKRGSSYLS